MSYNIKVLTSDNDHIEFDCEPDENVLAAAERANIYLPSGCKDGGCGNCIGKCSSDRFDLKKYSDAILSDAARAQNTLLMCQTYPKDNLQIKVDYPRSKIVCHELTPINGKISAIETIALNTVRLEVIADEYFSFNPGQYVDLTLDGVTRSYSMSNAPNFENKLEFLIKIKPNGAFSTLLMNTNVGDSIKIKGPFGAFTVKDQSLNERWFVAGGTGLAPILSILRTMVEFNDMTPTILFFGVNTEEELFLLEELRSFTNTLKLNLIISVVKGGCSDCFSGYPTVKIEHAMMNLVNNSPDIYICGPDPLLQGVRQLAAKYDISSDNLSFEVFG